MSTLAKYLSLVFRSCSKYSNGITD